LKLLFLFYLVLSTIWRVQSSGFVLAAERVTQPLYGFKNERQR